MKHLFSILLYVVATALFSQDPERVFGGYGKLQTLAVSRDGKKIAFSSDYRDGKGDIVLYNLITKTKAFVSKFPELDSQPAFSEDGSHLYFFSRHGATGGIWKAAADGSTVQRITPENVWCEFPALSPDGKSLAYYSRRDANYGLYLLDLSSQSEKKITENKFFNFGPVFSEDGKEIYFYSNRDGLFSIYKVLLENNSIAPVRGPGGFTISPSSSFHDSIFAVSNVKGDNDIYRLYPSGDSAPKAFIHYPGNDLYPVVDSAGPYLYFFSQKEGDSAIYRIRLE